jgi:hypothetical protein
VVIPKISISGYLGSSPLVRNQNSPEILFNGVIPVVRICTVFPEARTNKLDWIYPLYLFPLFHFSHQDHLFRHDGVDAKCPAGLSELWPAYSHRIYGFSKKVWNPWTFPAGLYLLTKPSVGYSEIRRPMADNSYYPPTR